MFLSFSPKIFPLSPEAAVICESLKVTRKGITFLNSLAFVTKLENHPGIDSAKFLAQHKGPTGRMQKCYDLPKYE